MNPKFPLIACGLVAVWFAWSVSTVSAQDAAAAPAKADAAAAEDAAGGEAEKAETAPAAPTDEEEVARVRKEASDHFRRGVELFQESAYRAALVEFERAFEILPDHRLHYNIGQTKLQVQDYLGAMTSYEKYLVEGGAAVKKGRRQEVERQLELLRGRVARLAITVNLDGAQIFVDDHLIGRSPITETTAVNVGRHRVVARTDDGAQATKVIDVAGGDLLELELELEEIELKVAGAADDKPPMTTMRKVSVVTLGVGALALVGTVVAAVTAGAAESDFDAARKETPPDLDAARNHQSKAESAALAADVLGIATIALVATGVTLWFVGSPDDKPPANDGVAVSWGIGPGTIAVRGAF